MKCTAFCEHVRRLYLCTVMLLTRRIWRRCQLEPFVGARMRPATLVTDILLLQYMKCVAAACV